MTEKIKDLTEEEVGLLLEMKDRCLSKGQYKDEKAKEKFKMLCHLEDYAIQFYDLKESNLSMQEEMARTWKKLDDLQQIEQEHQKINGELRRENKKYKEVIDKAIDYLNKYAWQEDIIGGIYTTTGKPAIDRYMQLEWDNCNELLDILKEVE